MTAAVMLLLWYVTVDRAENCDTSSAMLDTVHKEANEDDIVGEAGSLPKMRMNGREARRLLPAYLTGRA